LEEEVRRVAEAAAQAAQEAAAEAHRAEVATGVPHGLPSAEHVSASSILGDKVGDNSRERA
jgi:hypothetical protein